jgi:hypothetical protein
VRIHLVMVAGLSNPTQASVWMKLRGSHTHIPKHSNLERDNNRSLGKNSLPGERQGTSGTSAGRSSIRATGDRMLSRRAPVGLPENITAEDTQTVSGNTQQQEVTSALSAS